MLTLFSTPKAYRGHIAVIQTNALQSWIRLSPPCEIILFGDEEGIAEKAVEFGVRHEKEVLKNEYGTPLLNDLFEKAQALGTHDLMCYINADIILMNDFARAVEHIHRLKRSFLMVGQRWDIDLWQLMDFGEPNWDEHFQAYVRKYGKPSPADWIDYFVFPRGFYHDVLPLAIGRAGFDNWLLWKARDLRAPLVNASEVIMPVHQNHDYSHHPQGQEGVWFGSEANRNRELIASYRHFFNLSDATHRLTSKGLELNLKGDRFIRMVWVRGILLPWYWLLTRTLPLRRRLGLRKSNIESLWKFIRDI